MRPAPYLAVALAAVAIPGLAACGSSSSDDTTTKATSIPAGGLTTAKPADTTASSTASTGPVAVDLSEWKVAPAAATVKAGKVTFDAKNVGQVPHELVVIKTDKPAGDLGTGSEVSEKGSVGEIGDLTPGKSGSKTLDLKPGKYVLICNLPGHYMQGMHTAFTVN